MGECRTIFDPNPPRQMAMRHSRLRLLDLFDALDQIGPFEAFRQFLAVLRYHNMTDKTMSVVVR
jgi:hypothetical protein